MAKIKTTICDICGETVYEHARQQYQIRKKFWEANTLWTNIDLCEECYIEMCEYIKKKCKKGL